MKYFPIQSAMAALTLLVITQTPVLSHATLETTEAVSGSAYKAVIRIGHGCEGSPTLTVRVKVPEGLIGVKPMPKPGWSLTTTKGSYATPHTLYGKPVSEGVTEIIWSGGKLLDEHYDEFVFRGVVSKAVGSGKTLYVPVTQECEKGQHAWVEIPASGQDSQSLKAPAPSIRIAAGTTTETMPDIKIGNLIITQPWSREAPPSAKVAGAYLTIRNNGTTPDRLLTVESQISDVTEIHEMSHANGVMKMQKLEAGLEIKPGETVQLAPGGFHVMFMGLKQTPKAGTNVPATLVFEKAGRVAVAFEIQPIGAAKPVTANPAHEEHKH